MLGFQLERTSTEQLLRDWQSSRFFLSINVDVLMKLRRDPEFRAMAMEHAADTKLINDSQVIKFAVRLILGKRLGERVSGSDFLPAFCKYAQPDVRLFLLGGMNFAADEAMEKINSRSGRRVVVDALSPSFGFEKKSEECVRIVQRIRDSGANVVAVGLGTPKQEKWIFRTAAELPGVKLFLPVGATIDFEAGRVPRAPKWLSNAGLEWLFRLLTEPRRLYRRYLIEGPPFFWLLLKQKFGRLPSL